MTETDFFTHFFSSFNHHLLWRWELFEVIVFKFNEKTVRFQNNSSDDFPIRHSFCRLVFTFHPCFHLSSFFDTFVKHCLTLLIPWYIARKIIVKNSSSSTTVTCFFLTCCIHFLLFHPQYNNLQIFENVRMMKNSWTSNNRSMVIITARHCYTLSSFSLSSTFLSFSHPPDQSYILKSIFLFLSFLQKEENVGGRRRERM